jgi:hypothetical protein
MLKKKVESVLRPPEPEAEHRQTRAGTHAFIDELLASKRERCPYRPELAEAGAKKYEQWDGRYNWTSRLDRSRGIGGEER